MLVKGASGWYVVSCTPFCCDMCMDAVSISYLPMIKPAQPSENPGLSYLRTVLILPRINMTSLNKHCGTSNDKNTDSWHIAFRFFRTDGLTRGMVTFMLTYKAGVTEFPLCFEISLEGCGLGSKTHLKPESCGFSLLIQPISLKCCTEHGRITVMICAKFQNYCLTERNVMDEWYFVSLRRVSDHIA